MKLITLLKRRIAALNEAKKRNDIFDKALRITSVVLCTAQLTLLSFFPQYTVVSVTFAAANSILAGVTSIWRPGVIAKSASESMRNITAVTQKLVILGEDDQQAREDALKALSVQEMAEELIQEMIPSSSVEGGGVGATPLVGNDTPEMHYSWPDGSPPPVSMPARESTL